jgi:hypothetical protein
MSRLVRSSSLLSPFRFFSLDCGGGGGGGRERGFGVLEA